MQGLSGRALILPAAIALVAAGAVVSLWYALRSDHEQRVANIVEATSYATRSELARRLIEQFQSLRALADYWSRAEDPTRTGTQTPLEVIRFEGIDAIAWSNDDGTHFLASGANPVAGYVPSATEWVPLEPFVAEARAVSGATTVGPFVDAAGHATFRYYVPIRRGAQGGVLVAVIDAHDLLGTLLLDEALGYAIRVACCNGVELYRRGAAEERLPGAWIRDGWIAPVDDVRWNIMHLPTPQLAADLETSAVDSVLLVGLTLALLLGGLVFETRRANERAAAASTAEQRIHKLHRELEDRVVARTQKLDDVLRDLNTINLSVSHDLRSPLSSISLVVGQLQEANRDDAVGRRLDKIAAAVTRMTAMLDRLLGYAHASSFASEFEDVDMRALAEQVVREQSLDERSVSIGALPPTRADRVLTHILLSNLIANAGKHGRGGRALRIEIGSMVADTGVPTYFVRDNGPGIEPALADRLFKPLADRPRTGTAGLGLGLAIAARAAESHGGKIWVESAAGRGATFLFTLRAPPPRDDEADSAD